MNDNRLTTARQRRLTTVGPFHIPLSFLNNYHLQSE